MRASTRARAAVLVAAWLVALAFGGVARAADGDLDPTFGGDGKVATPFPNGAFADAVAIQPDGMIVVAGAAAPYSSTGSFALARYDAGGVLDPAFGTNGKLTTAISPDGNDQANEVVIQPDGKIVVAGTNTGDFEVVRYDGDGSLDATFGTGGIVVRDLSGGDESAYAAALQPDGKIVVGGAVATGPWRSQFALVRYDTDGTLDPTFGTDGIVMTKFGSGGSARAVVLQPNGKIVVAGTNGDGFALVRYLPDGSLDTTFGGDGKVAGPTFGGGWAVAVALQPDGKIVAAGAYDFFNFAVARYTVHGDLDPTFSHDGALTTDVGGGEQGAHAVVVLPSGKIVAVGFTGPHEGGEPPGRFVLVRYRANGVLDPVFSGDGKVYTKFDGGAGANAATLQPDGKIVAVGGKGLYGDDGFAIARYIM